jgi:hypothetical protein
MAEQLDFEEAWQQLVAKAWSDPALKAKLLADPVAAMKDNGLIVPAGITIKVLENTDKVINLVLPVKPSAAELSQEELQQAAGGYCRRCGCGRCGCGCERCGCARCY